VKLTTWTRVLWPWLETEMTIDPELLLNKIVLEFHHPKSVWHMREAQGFGSLASAGTLGLDSNA